MFAIGSMLCCVAAGWSHAEEVSTEEERMVAAEVQKLFTTSSEATRLESDALAKLLKSRPLAAGDVRSPVREPRLLAPPKKLKKFSPLSPWSSPPE